MRPMFSTHKYLTIIFLLLLLSGCQDSLKTAGAAKPSYEDKGENIYFIPHSTSDIIVDSLKLLKKENPNIDIQSITEITGTEGGNFKEPAGYLIVGKEIE